MADKENRFSLEQRSYCKIRALLVYSPSDIKADLDKVYGVNVLSYHMVARWVRNFKDGRESVENEPRPGRPLRSLGESEISAVKNCSKDRCAVHSGRNCGDNKYKFVNFEF